MSDVYGPGLRQLSVSELTETLEEVETAIRHYSEELIQALALRDELDYEKEVLSSETSKGNAHLFILRRHFSIICTCQFSPETCFRVQVKNSFISLLIDVQNRQKEHRELLRKKKKIRSTTTTGPNGQRTTSTHIPGTVSHAHAGDIKTHTCSFSARGGQRAGKSLAFLHC